MSFEIRVVGEMPLEAETDYDEALHRFLEQIGYIERASTDNIGYMIFRQCFMERPERVWTAEEIASVVGTSKPTVYRYIRKLKSMGLIEEGIQKRDPEPSRKGYMLRYGDLVRAWSFVESHVRVSMENYRRSVEHIARMAREREGKEI